MSSGSWKVEESTVTRKGDGGGPTTMSIRPAALHSKHSSLSTVEYERPGWYWGDDLDYTGDGEVTGEESALLAHEAEHKASDMSTVDEKLSVPKPTKKPW